MKLLPFSIAYREVVWTNGTMLAILGGLFGSARLFDSYGLLLVFLLVAMLFALLELALCLRALFTGHFYLCLIYGALFIMVAKVDWWLLEQAE
jgi:hypothetical protein